ncbi:alpha/beta hydrolase [Actinophytocola sp.]|uniref:alpha/beta hydrolase n=1 Tax=Actinophytocola sp. TaxID=1872138 RepID=UPI002ED2FEB9
MKRALFATALTVGAVLTGTATAQAENLDWQACSENPAVQCGTVTVPIDYAQPRTGTIEVAVARKPATDPARRIGALFVLPGGPGGSGVEEMLYGTVPPEIAARFDLVSFDPRGTNRSNPVVCDADLLARMPSLVPEMGATLASVKQYSRALGDSCRARTGPLIDHVDSVSTARDIDTIRAALGERKLTLFGESYGTLVGQMYAEQFPHRVRALVLDSVFDHSLSLSRFVLSEARTGEDSFTEFANWCAANTECVLHGQDVRQVYGDLYAKALRGELSIGGPLELARATTRFFNDPRWPEAAEFLRSLAEQRAVRAADEVAPFPLATLCADHVVRFSSEREWRSLWDRQSTVAPTMRTHFAWGFLSLCADWPGAVANPQHRTDASGAPPILLMNALHDPATGYEWAQNVQRQLKGSVLLTYDGWGHGVASRSDCTLAAVTEYVVDRRLPRPNTHCAAVPPGN